MIPLARDRDSLPQAGIFLPDKTRAPEKRPGPLAGTVLSDLRLPLLQDAVREYNSQKH